MHSRPDVNDDDDYDMSWPLGVVFFLFHYPLVLLSASASTKLSVHDLPH